MDNYVKTPTVYQMEATECGAASLSMIFSYFGKFLPLEQMRIETGVSRDGCNAGNIMRAAKRYGLDCHGYRREPEQLVELKPPCIIHWNFNHFVVFEGIKNGSAYLNDPAVGRRKLTMEELDEGFTGIVLTFEPTDAFEKEKAPRTLVASIKQKLEGQYPVVAKLLYIGLLLVFPGLVLPVLSQVFMDDVLVGGYTDWLGKLLTFMGCCVALKMGLTWYRGRLLEKFSSKMTLMSTNGFLRHMLRLPMSFFDQRYAGDLVSRMECNTSINTFISGELAATVLNILVAVFYLVILLLYSPLLTLVGLLNAGVCIGVMLLSNARIANTTMKIQMSAGKLYGAICAGVSITDTIKASGAETEYTSRILGYQAKQVNEEQQLNRFQQMIGAVPGAAGNVADVLLLMLGGILVIRGHMTMGMLVAFNSLFDSFCEPINDLVKFFRSLQTLKANLARVDDIEKYPQDYSYEVQNEDAAATSKLSGDLELRGISFGYSSLKPPLIEDFSFTLHTGESIAFVGPSGCGKSTIAKVTSGLYQPWEGEVLVDGGRKLSEIPKAVRNASVSNVSQNIALFSGTIRDNLTMWNSAVLEEDMINAAKDAEIHDFIISQPGGYDYMLTEGADNLSGGQRQRLEIARALTIKPSILIMDEATSALDPITEKKVLDNVRKRGCTCVIVAHRLSAIRDCNQIVVMQHGKIIQRGTHRKLRGEDGYYRVLIQNT